jgi:hypothetical protein
MQIKLLTHTPYIESLVATAMLTTTSSVPPAIFFERLKKNPEQVKKIVSRLEIQHGSILEHNSLVWQVEANQEEILKILLECVFFNFTRLGATNWLLSCNLRTLVEYFFFSPNEFSRLLLDSMKHVAPTIYSSTRRGEK